MIKLRFKLQFGLFLRLSRFLHLKFALLLPILYDIKLLLNRSDLVVFLFGQLIPSFELLLFKKIKLVLEVFENRLILFHLFAEVDLHFRKLSNIFQLSTLIQTIIYKDFIKFLFPHGVEDFVGSHFLLVYHKDSFGKGLTTLLSSTSHHCVTGRSLLWSQQLISLSNGNLGSFSASCRRLPFSTSRQLTI